MTVSLYRHFRTATALTVLLVGSAYAATAARATAVSPEDARHVLTLLSAVGEEYREGVQDGTTVRPIELEEAQAFMQDARLRWQKLAAQLPEGDLTQLFDEASLAIANRAAANDLTAKLTQLRQRVAAVSGVPEEVYPPKAPSATHGQALFDEHCASCHGQRGDGKGPSAAWLKPPPANFTEAQFMRGETPYDFYHVISLGKKNTAMPAWDEVLSVQDRWDLVSYVWTFASTSAGAAEGQGLYLAHCASCHGVGGDGRGAFADILMKSAPDLSQPQAMARQTDAELFAATTHGIAGSPMPAFAGALREDERWKAVAFLRLLSLGGPKTRTGTLEFGPLTTPVSSVPDGAQSRPTDAEAALVECGRLLDAGMAAYARGDAPAPLAVADAYLQFEPLEQRLGGVAPGLKERTEADFLRLRQILRTPGHGAEAQAGAREIHQDLTAVRTALQPHASPYALFIESATIILREGLEIVLVIGALIAYVVKTRNLAMQRAIYAGVALGVAASFVTAFVLSELLHLQPAASDVLEGLTMLLAAVVLFWVSYWLISKSEAARWQRYIQSRVETALTGGRSLALGSAAFLAVYREGFETVLFYQALYASAPTASMTVTLGFIAGAIALLLVYFLFRRFEIHIPIRQFFFVTGLFLYIMAVVFAGQGIHELQDAGMIGATFVAWVPTLPLIGMYPSVESLAAQGIFVALLLYATVVTLRRGTKVAAEKEDDAATELRALRTVMEGIRQELNSMRISQASPSLAAVGDRLEGLLVRVEELAGKSDVNMPGAGRANGGGSRQ
ncbi:MAG TPA: FTR1 family protein [Candidatus Binatia bacterium]